MKEWSLLIQVPFERFSPSHGARRRIGRAFLFSNVKGMSPTENSKKYQMPCLAWDIRKMQVILAIVPCGIHILLHGTIGGSNWSFLQSTMRERTAHIGLYEGHTTLSYTPIWERDSHTCYFIKEWPLLPIVSCVREMLSQFWEWQWCITMHPSNR